MTVAKPHYGSFRVYAEEAFGPGLGFVVGWVYWTGLILAMSSEATAAAALLRVWLPQLPLAGFATIIILMVTLFNLLGAKALSHLESSLAAIKIGALILFVGIALALIVGFYPGIAPVGAGALLEEPLLAGGIGGAAGSLLIVIFCYAGFEVIGLAASETSDPHRTIPRAINTTVLSLVLLYVAVIACLLPLIPTTELRGEESPLVAALSAWGLTWAAGSINVILLTAILSTMLAATFGLGRMVRSMADAGHAPAQLIDRTDVPYRGIIFSGLVMLAMAGMGYLLPQRIYIFLVSSGGFALLFTYLVILATHYKFRMKNGCPPKGSCQLWGFPYSSWLAMLGLALAIGAMPLIPGQGSGLYAGLIFLSLYGLIYRFLYQPRGRSRYNFQTKPLFRRTPKTRNPKEDKDK